MSIFGVLFVLFLVLKLIGVITWSWWLVFLPLIVPVGVYLLLCLVVGAGFIAACGVFKK